MGKTIEVRLSDAQHAQLTAEAANAGLPFFGYCRKKLTELVTPPVTVVGGWVDRGHHDRQRAEMREDDRIARIEDAVAKITDYVVNSFQGPAPEPLQPVDVDSIVESQFHEAEAQGLTEHIPDENEEVMRHAGVRPLSRRPIPFSANSGPKHLAGL